MIFNLIEESRVLPDDILRYQYTAVLRALVRPSGHACGLQHTIRRPVLVDQHVPTTTFYRDEGERGEWKLPLVGFGNEE